MYLKISLIVCLYSSIPSSLLLFRGLFKSIIVRETIAMMPEQFILLTTPSTISPVNSSALGGHA
jgi:hypothetical protein